MRKQLARTSNREQIHSHDRYNHDRYPRVQLDNLHFFRVIAHGVQHDEKASSHHEHVRELDEKSEREVTLIFDDEHLL